VNHHSPKYVLTLMMSAVLLSGSWAAARTPGRGAPDKETAAQNERRRMLASKLKLLDALTMNSTVARRIEESSNNAAKQSIAKAKGFGIKARRLLEAGRDEAAEQMADSALRAVTEASQLVADQSRVRQIEEQRYGELRSRILSFREAFERIAVEKRDGQVRALLDQGDIDVLFGASESLAAKGDFGAANAKLEAIAAAVESAVSTARHQETLTHELKFDSPAEEYAYEQQRNRSYEMLIGLLQSRPASHAARVNVQKMLERNETLRDDARTLADRGETEAALEKLELATEYLVRTLRMSDLAFP